MKGTGCRKRKERNVYLKVSRWMQRFVERDRMEQRIERKYSFIHTGWRKWNELNDSFKIDGVSPAVAVVGDVYLGTSDRIK